MAHTISQTLYVKNAYLVICHVYSVSHKLIVSRYCRCFESVTTSYKLLQQISFQVIVITRIPSLSSKLTTLNPRTEDAHLWCQSLQDGLVLRFKGQRTGIPRSRTCSTMVFSCCSTLGFLGILTHTVNNRK